MSEPSPEALDDLFKSLGDLVSSGLTKFHQQSPIAGRHIYQQLEQQRGSVRVVIDMAPFHIRGQFINDKNEVIDLFSLSNDSKKH